MPMLARTAEESVLLRLVRNESIADLLPFCDAEGLVRTASRHMVLSPLADRLEKDPDIDPAWRRVGIAIALSAKRERILHETALAKSVSLLESAGTKPVVIKGLSLAMDRPRDSGDIDLLINESDLVAAISALEAAGYEYAGFKRNLFIKKSEYRDWGKLSRWSNQYEFWEPGTKALVELHTAFFETGRVYDEDMRALRSAMPGFMARGSMDARTGYRFLALEDRALLLALHAGLKRSPSRKNFILRHIIDLEALIGTGLDWRVVVERAARLGCSHHLLLLLRLYEEAKGIRIDRRLIEDLKSSLDAISLRAVRMHLRCMKSLGGYSTYTCFMYEWLSSFAFSCTARSRLRAALVLPLLVPPAFRIARIYGLPGRSPWIAMYYLLEPLRLTRRFLSRAFLAHDRPGVYHPRHGRRAQ